MTVHLPVKIHQSQTSRMIKRTQIAKSELLEHKHMPLKHLECLLCSRYCARNWVLTDEREMMPAIKKFAVVRRQGRGDNKTNHYPAIQTFS